MNRADPAPLAPLIVIEGGEGAGKSTLARRIAGALAAALPVLRTREPGGAPGAERLRALLLGDGRWDPMTELLLHFAARREHLAATVAPARAAGIWVVCDRFLGSTIAYQGAGLQLGEALVRRLAELVLPGVQPDLTILLDIDPALGLARAGARGSLDRYERADLAFHARIRDSFLAQAAAAPERHHVLDARQPPEALARAALAALVERLGARLPTAA